MKNLTKAAIAGGAGLVLLLGGATTIAYWTDEEDGGGGVIQAGTLDLGTVTGGGWMISHEGSGGEPTEPVPFDPATDQIVPGDLLSYTQDVPVELQGENIAAGFAGTIAVTPTEAGDPDEAFAAALESDPDLIIVELSDVTGDLTLVDGTLTGEGTGTVAVSTQIRFPWGTEGEFNTAKLGSVSFAVDYTLTQVPANAA